MNNVDHPTHYNQIQGVECIEVIEQLNLGFHLSNALKYIWRCKDKGKKVEDLKKAIWYLEREIANTERMQHVEETTNTTAFFR